MSLVTPKSAPVPPLEGVGEAALAGSNRCRVGRITPPGPRSTDFARGPSHDHVRPHTNLETELEEPLNDSAGYRGSTAKPKPRRVPSLAAMLVIGDCQCPRAVEIDVVDQPGPADGDQAKRPFTDSHNIFTFTSRRLCYTCADLSPEANRNATIS